MFNIFMETSLVIYIFLLIRNDFLEETRCTANQFVKKKVKAKSVKINSFFAGKFLLWFMIRIMAVQTASSATAHLVFFRPPNEVLKILKWNGF